MFEIEMTDTFGGETNYSWVTRSEDKTSRTLSGAIRKFKKDNGIKTRHRESDDLLSLLHHIDDTIREVKEIEESEDMTYRCMGCEKAQYDTGSQRVVFGITATVCGKCAPKFDKPKAKPKKRKAK